MSMAGRGGRGAYCSPVTDDAPRCSVTSVAVGERLAGSAAVTTSWLLVEQPLRWQRDAGDSPHPGYPDAMTRLFTRAGELDVRLQLLRRPAEKEAVKDEPWVPLVVLATTDPARGRAAQARLRPEQLDELADGGTLDALVRGDLPGTWAPVERLWAVCTHGRRDACCALHGRRLATAVTEAEPGLVWETTHLGGHRFAPTLLVLPEGLVYGRVAPERVDEVVTAQRQGRVVPDLLRGRAALPAATQVAEVALRQHLRATAGDDVTLVSSGPVEVDAAAPTVTRTPSRWAAGGREWRVVVDATPASPRPVSCGADPTRPVEHTLVELTDVESAGRGATGWDARHRRAEAPSPDDADPRVLDTVRESADGPGADEVDAVGLSTVERVARGRALDLACGTGRHSLALARLGWSVTSVDFSRTGLSALRSAADDLGLDVTTVLADARTWAADDDGYDLVLASFVHVPGVIGRAASWLRPGGRVVVVGHAVRNLTDGVGGPSDARLLHDPDALRAGAHAAGLTVVRCVEVGRQTPDGTAFDVVLVAVRPS